MRKGHRRTQSAFTNASNNNYLPAQNLSTHNICSLLQKSEEKISNKIVTLEKLEPNSNSDFQFGNSTIHKFNHGNSGKESGWNQEESLLCIPETNDSESEEGGRKQKGLKGWQVKPMRNKYGSGRLRGYKWKENKSYLEIYQSKINLLGKKKREGHKKYEL